MTAKKRSKLDEGPQAEPQVRAVALVRDKGGYRLVTMAMPESAVAAYAQKVAEPEVLPIVMGMALEALEEPTR